MFKVRHLPHLIPVLGLGLLGCVLSFSVGFAQELPPSQTIQAITIEENGLGRIDETGLLRGLSIQAGDPFDPVTIIAARDQLLTTGSFDSIDPLVEDSPEGPIVVLALRTKPILKAVEFAGLKEIDASEARKLLALALGERTDATELAAAGDRLAKGLAEKGFLEATVKWKAIPLGNGEITGSFEVFSGVTYKIGEIEISGWPAMERLPIKGMETGSPFIPENLIPFAQDLEWQLRDNGYAFAHVDLIWTPTTDRTVNIPVTTGPGGRFVVNRILIEGLEVTDPAVAQSSIGTQPGTLYREASIQADSARLLNRGIFGEAQPEAVQVGPDKVDIVYRLKEKPSGRFMAGLEFGQDEGLAFVAELGERNFSFTPPFRGDGIDANLRGVIGTERLQLSARAFQPSYRGGPWFYGMGASAAQLEYLSDQYNQRQYGFDFFSGRTFDNNWSAALGYQYSHFEVYDVTAAAPALIQEEEGTSRFAGPFVQLGLNTVKGTLRPESGLTAQARLELGSKIFPGDVEVIGSSIGAEWFASPFSRHTLSVKGRFRTMTPYGSTDRAPLPLREFLGGYDNLRGFNFRSVSPRNEEGDEIGGETSWFASVEYAVPVPGVSFLDVSAFMDIGLVGLDSFDLGSGAPASDVGIAVLVRADNFPLRVNIATPTSIPENDTENETGQVQVSFSAGYAF